MSVHDLKLHESVEFSTIVGGKIRVVRVPGGWLYNECFVPFNEEFIIKKLPTNDPQLINELGQISLKKFKKLRNAGKKSIDELRIVCIKNGIELLE